MEAPQQLLQRAQRRRKRIWITAAVVAAIIGLLVIIVPCAVLLPHKAGPIQPAVLLLPLYIYPTADAWEPLYRAAAAHRNVNFTVIVNPHSGPGAMTIPGPNYVSAIKRLNAVPNVRTVGYVRTGYTRRDIDLVVGDVATYSAWSQYDADLAMHGIFFDETPHDYSSFKREYLATANQAVGNASGLREPKLILHNPGTIPDPRLQDSRTDVTVIFENSFVHFQQRQDDLAMLSGSRSSYSLMVHSVPGGEDLGRFVRRISHRAEYLFLTTATEGYYEHFGDSWAKFVSVMAR